MRARTLHKAGQDTAVEVAAGILADAHGRVLLMQRLPGKHLAGLWEFPGGKLEAGESVERALARELDEELGIEVLASASVIAVPWRYPEKTVHLNALRVTAWRGEPRAREGHPLRWVALPEVDVLSMPPADVPIVAALRLPMYYRVAASATDAAPARAVAAQAWPAAGSAGPEAPDTLWQWRMPGASRTVARCAAQSVLATDPGLRTRLLVAHDIELARDLGVGVHLRAEQLRALHERPLPRSAWVGASCHGAQDLEAAARLGVDFATLSPAGTAPSRPDAASLGWKRFARLVAQARLPVYALGGVGPDDLAQARAAGGQGVADTCP